MKKLENKGTEILKNDKGQKLHYCDMLSLCLDVAPKEGWIHSIQRERFKHGDLIKDVKEGEEFSLEDAEFKYFYDLSLKMPWTKKHRDILAFHDYLEEVNTQ